MRAESYASDAPGHRNRQAQARSGRGPPSRECYSITDGSATARKEPADKPDKSRNNGCQQETADRRAESDGAETGGGESVAGKHSRRRKRSRRSQPAKRISAAAFPAPASVYSARTFIRDASPDSCLPFRRWVGMPSIRKSVKADVIHNRRERSTPPNGKEMSDITHGMPPILKA
jgi:hypothetical protein